MMTWIAVIETIEKFWLQFFLSAISGIIVLLWKKMNQARKDQKKAREEQRAEDETIKQAVKALLSDRLLQSCEFFIEAGYVTDMGCSTEIDDPLYLRRLPQGVSRGS